MARAVSNFAQRHPLATQAMASFIGSTIGAAVTLVYML